MNARLLMVIISALMAIAAMFGIWFFWVGEIVSHALTINLKDIPTSNVVMACLIPVAALLGLLSRWNDSKKNRDE